MQIKNTSIYETDELVSQYCDFQYGEEYFGVSNFARTCAQKAIFYSKDTPQIRALDLGCATGYASFELAKAFEQVSGIDYSQAFVDVGVKLQSNRRIGYYQHGEGALKSYVEVDLKAFGFESVSHKVQFSQGDACALAPEVRGFDLIMATNLIDRLYKPYLFLEAVHERLNEGGYLVLTSPYTWKEKYTAKEFWLGGYHDHSGREVTTLDGLHTLLDPHFDLVAMEDIPFVIRETPRKFQYTISHMSVWKKKAV